MPSKISYLVTVVAFALALPLSLSFAFDAHGQSAEQDFQNAKKFIDAEKYKEAVPLLRKAAEQGSADAQLELGVLYFNGNGVEQDTIKALEWYEQAADQGKAEAMHRIGGLYDIGCGVIYSAKTADRWYRKASRKGYAKADKLLEVYSPLGSLGRKIVNDAFKEVIVEGFEKQGKPNPC